MIKYKKGYKYQLHEDYTVHTAIKPSRRVQSAYITLTAGGRLTIRAGYAWDGPSGPTVDTKNFMRGALIHDALYQLMREEKINRKNKKKADLELHKACREDGMLRFRAWYVLKSMRFTGFATNPQNKKEIIEAP
jgi:hypothetical protein